AEIMVPLAVAFLHMMFAHAEFEEQVRVLQTSIMKTPANRPHFLARLLRLSFGAKKKAIAARLGLGAPQSWSAEQAIAAWGWNMAVFSLGWLPTQRSVTRWIASELT